MSNNLYSVNLNGSSGDKYKIRPLFKKYQRELVAFANTRCGRDFIGKNSIREDLPIVKVTPNSIHQQIDKNTFRAVFHSKYAYEELFAEVLTMVDIANKNNYRVGTKELPLVIPHFLGETRLLRNKLPTIYLASGDAIYNTSGEVNGYMEGTNASWATIWGATSAGSTANGSTGGLIANASRWSGYYISRIIVGFNTSALTSGATVLTAITSLYCDETAVEPNVALVTATPASSTAIADGDYDQLGATEGSDARTTCVAAQYNNWTLNSTGRGWVNKTGITILGFRKSRDLDNSAPVTDEQQSNVTFTGNGYAGTTRDPKLVITYTLPPSGFFALL